MATPSARAALVGALVGGIAPLVVIVVAVTAFWIIYVGPRLAGENRHDVTDLVLVVVLGLGTLAGLSWLGMRSLRAAGAPNAGAATGVAMAVGVATAMVVAGPASSVGEFGVVVAFAGAVTCSFAVAVGGRRGVLLGVLLGLVAGAAPTALLAAFAG